MEGVLCTQMSISIDLVTAARTNLPVCFRELMTKCYVKLFDDKNRLKQDVCVCVFTQANRIRIRASMCIRAYVCERVCRYAAQMI